MFHRLFCVLLLGAVACGLLAWTRIPTLPQVSWSLFDVTAPDNPRHPLNRGLVAHWQVLPQTNQAGSLWRSTAPGAAPLPGTLAGMLPTSATSGWNGTTRPGGFGEMRFNGTSAVIDLGATSVGSRMQGAAGVTLALWVKYTSLAAAGENLFIAVFTAGNASAIRMGLFGGTPGIVALGGRSIWSDSYQEISTTGTLTVSTWTHVVGVANYQASTLAIYLNGVLDTSAGVAFSQTTFDNNTGASSADVLGATDNTQFEFAGALDDVRILTRALSAPEVAALYDATRTLHNPTLQWLPYLVAQPSGVLAFKPRRSGAY